MKLLTLNVHAWMEENQEEKLNVLADAIADSMFDVIALQEVNQKSTSPKVIQDLGEDNYGLALLKLLKERGIAHYSYHWSPSHIGYDIYDEGIAILSKYPVQSVEAFYTSKSQNIYTIDSRKIIVISVLVGNRLVEFYSCHMNLPFSKTEDQDDNLTRLVEHSKSDGLKIFMGDFNTDAIGSPEAYQNILNHGLYDTYILAKERDSGITVSSSIDGWKNQMQNKRLDYIFVNQKVEVSSSRVIFNQSHYPIVSDHFGLEVDLKL